MLYFSVNKVFETDWHTLPGGFVANEHLGPKSSYPILPTVCQSSLEKYICKWMYRVSKNALLDTDFHQAEFDWLTDTKEWSWQDKRWYKSLKKYKGETTWNQTNAPLCQTPWNLGRGHPQPLLNERSQISTLAKLKSFTVKWCVLHVIFPLFILAIFDHWSLMIIHWPLELNVYTYFGSKITAHSAAHFYFSPHLFVC